jgi:SpoIID/LytB domain protein
MHATRRRHPLTESLAPACARGFTSTGERRVRLALATFAVLVVLLALLVLLASDARAASAVNFTIKGRGWGHGIGMSQYGAYGFATHSDLTYKQILQHYYTGIGFGDAGNPPIRVMLNTGLRAVSATAATAFKATDGTKTKTIAGGVVAKVTWVGGTSPYQVVAGSATYRFSAPVVFKPGTSFLKLVNANQNGYAGVHYRGQLRVVHFTTGLMVVNVLALQSYLYGVVPFESPASWPATALRVQAVAARSYALATRKSGAFDVYCTTASQYYGGLDAGHGEEPSTTRAVKDTAGVVATYGGKPIVAYYFSTSGGHTESIENVWGSAAPVPYLKGVTDPYDGASPYHVWKPVTVSAGSVASKLGTYSPGNPSGVEGLLKTIYVTKRGTSPRVITAYVVGDAGIHPISGASLRANLGLRDTWVFFRSMSIAPSQGTHKVVVFGSGATLAGRTYPALASDAAVTLHFYRSGAWHTQSLAITNGSIALPNGTRARYSAYSHPAKPTRTTRYYISYGSSGARTPETTISVRPVITVAASKTAVAPGDALTLSGRVKPVLAGKPVYLQTKSGGTWSNVASVKLDAAGGYTFTWTAPATSGDVSLRVRIPATTGLLTAASPAVVVTIG